MSATPYPDLTDEALARLAAGGDADAFAQLFDRHLAAVFRAAWSVLRDRAVAAEIARDTFAAAWPQIGAVPAAEVADSLVESATRKAEAWLDENPQGRAVVEASPDDATPPSLGPVLRARIVTALEVQGVPTRVRPAPGSVEAAAVDPLLDTGPPTLGTRLSQAAEWLRAAWAGRRRVATVGLGVGIGVLALAGGAAFAGRGEPTRADGVETAAAEPEPDRERDRDRDRAPRRTEDDRDAPDATTTTTAAPTTTTTTAPPTTEAPPDDDEDDTPPTPARAAAPATTTAPPPPTTAPRPSTTTAPVPTVPTILEFKGYSSGRSDCPSGQIRFHMSWRTVESTWVWVHTEGAVWEDVAAPDGSTSRCTTSGTLWYLEIRRQGDWLEDTATIRAP